jgi:hypothetical protein
MNANLGSRPELQTGSSRRVSFARLIDKLSGVETLDLSVAEPEPTAHFRLGQSDGAQFQKQTNDAAWRLSAAGNGLPFELRLPHKHGVVLILEMRRTTSAPQSEQPVLLNVNGEELPLRLDPHNLNFHRQSWYLPHYLMQEGENRLCLRLAPEANTFVLVKTAAVMRFEVEKQKRGNWCWAAVTNSLLSFFDAANGMTQCEIVQECFRVTPGYQTETDCCQHAGRAECNREYALDQALDLMQLRYSYCNYPLTLEEIREQINQGVPVAARIAWRGGGGHFVVITAVVTDPNDEQQAWLRIANPKDQVASYIPYRRFLTRYAGDGKWTHSYLFERQRQPEK